MSRLKTVVRAAVAVMLVSDAAAALCARRSVTASLLEWLYAKASGGGKGGAPFIMIGSAPFSPSEIAMLASPCILGVLLALLYGGEITGFLALCFSLFRHRHEAADSLPTLNMSADKLFKGGGRGRDPEGAGPASDGRASESPSDEDGGEYEGGWFDEEGWHDAQDFKGDDRSDRGETGMTGLGPEGRGSAAHGNSRSARAHGAGGAASSTQDEAGNYKD